MAIWKPTFTPKLKMGTYKKGVRVENWQPEEPRPGFKMPNFGIGHEGSGAHGWIKPTKLEKAKFERHWQTKKKPSNYMLDMRDQFERAEAGGTRYTTSQLRKHLARKVGTKFEPTGSVSNSRFDLRGGDLGVPSYGVSQMGREPMKVLLRDARRRAKRRKDAGPKGCMR